MANATEAYRFAMPTRTHAETTFLAGMEEAARKSITSNVERFRAFPLWAPRQDIARFLAQYEIYSKHVLPVHGSVIECGVCFGGGLMAWAHFASILEPVNHTRRVIGFDTFSGFPGIAPQDAKSKSGLAEAGGMAAPVEDEIAHLAELHDMNRPLGHIPRVELVKGDACEKIPRYVQENRHLVVALLVLDFDLYNPTKTALDCFVPLMPKGGVIVFDEANCKDWPGETEALLDFERETGLRLPLTRFPFASTLSYAVLA